MRLTNHLITLILIVGITCSANIASAIDIDSDLNSTGHLRPKAHEHKMTHGLPILQTDLTPSERLYWENYNTTTFFTMNSGHESLLQFHFSSLFIVVFILYPVCLVLNNVDSVWYLCLLTLTDALLTLSLSCYMIFMKNVEDLYPAAIYDKMSVVLFIFMLVHYASAILKTASKYFNTTGTTITTKFGGYDRLDNVETNNTIPMTELNLAGGHEGLTLELFEQLRNSNCSDDSSNFALRDGDDDCSEESIQSTSTQEQSQIATMMIDLLKRAFNHKIVISMARSFENAAFLSFNITNYSLLCFLFIDLVTGVTVLNLLGRDHYFFNLLAHFIKGGVFFAIGVLSLTRYLGAFQQIGLGWNYSYIGRYGKIDNWFLRWQSTRGIRSMMTMEMLESSMILFYGCTNVFLEHLAAPPGGEWTAKDLQHVSIAFMFIGCGLCGVLTECKLSNWKRGKFLDNLSRVQCKTGNFHIDEESIISCTPGFSPNPFPAFTIFFTGLLMSQHQQASMTSTEIHILWGNLLVYGSCFRLVTITLMMFWEHNNCGSMFEPFKPFTELLTSFCLIAGGLIFMESTDSVVEAIEYRGFTSMFVLNLNIGVVTVLMGWIMVLFVMRDFLKERK